MELRAQFSEYMDKQNVYGSGRAASYVRALDLLVPILAKSQSTFQDCSNLWNIDSVDKVQELYKYILEQQRLGECGLFNNEAPVSYWRDRYCSAALRCYKEFLIIYQHKKRLWKIVNESNTKATDLSKRLQKEKINSAQDLVSEKNYDFSTREGKDKLREVKTRVNQSFFRDLMLETYQFQCCVTGLNITSVLRASHILPWAKNVANRLNPENGLCLSATYDAAFDRHLISFNEDYRMIFSTALKEHYSNKAFQTQFKAFEGKQIIKPKRYCPNQEFLEKHRARLFV